MLLVGDQSLKSRRKSSFLELSQVQGIPRLPGSCRANRDFIAASVLLLVLAFPQATFANDRWVLLEKTPIGPKYVKGDYTIGPQGALVRTLINVDKPSNYPTDGGGSFEFRSIAFVEQFDCKELSREFFVSHLYSREMGTGVEIRPTSSGTRRIIYSKSEWVAKGYQEKFCKKFFEFWR